MRTFVMGDPQAPFAKVMEVLAHHGAVVGDRLAPDVHLISIGDHFDYDLHHPAEAGQEGLRVLRWLVDHDNVTLVAGNHDLSRVMELATINDEEFAAARAMSAEDFAATYPELPAHGVLARDYASFSSEQRALVMQLLLAGRFHLALTGTLLDGREAMITHAGVTTRELAMLGSPTTPSEIATALEAFLALAIDRVRDDWQRGELVPLSLEPLHLAGGAGEEGGGLLYHRPSNPECADKAWALDPSRPRRFDPRTLPPITQIVGHSGHAKTLYELGPWASEGAKARKHGGIRTLRVVDDVVTYELGVTGGGGAELIMIDGELRRVPADEFALLELYR